MENKTQNYYIGYPPTENIEDFESVIVGTLAQQTPLSNGQIVVKTFLGVEETPVQLQGFSKYDNAKDVQNEIEKIEKNGTN